jgi:hypothetical protein
MKNSQEILEYIIAENKEIDDLINEIEAKLEKNNPAIKNFILSRTEKKVIRGALFMFAEISGISDPADKDYIEISQEAVDKVSNLKKEELKLLYSTARKYIGALSEGRQLLDLMSEYTENSYDYLAEMTKIIKMIEYSNLSTLRQIIQ